MEITTSQVKGNVTVDIIHFNGNLDGASYTDFINVAKKLYAAGARRLVLDLTELKFMSSAGLAAIHIVTKIFGGEEAPDPEDGWNTFRQMDRDRDIVKKLNVKLLKPSENILTVLDVVGFKPIFEIFTDLNEAVQSF